MKDVLFMFGNLHLQDVENSRSYIDELYSQDNHKVQESLICLKNVVIGSDKQKTSVISQGVVPRLMIILSQDSASIGLRYDAAIVLGKSSPFRSHLSSS